jgi:hypothetical protein
MCASKKIRALLGAALLGPGFVMADGGEPATPTKPPAQVVPAMSSPLAWQAPVWVNMVPVPGNQPYSLMPQPGMAWPVLPQYPVPMATPPAWAPIIWVMVPLRPMALVPAETDYGPVADTPVIELPLPDEAPAIPAPEVAMPAPPMAEADRPVTEAGATAGPAATEASAAAATPEISAAPTAAAVGAETVDYGPVASTPVVDLRVLEQQAAAEGAPKPSTSNPARKAPSTASPKPRSTAADKPAKRRMCWTNGVVAPCR